MVIDVLALHMVCCLYMYMCVVYWVSLGVIGYSIQPLCFRRGGSLQIIAAICVIWLMCYMYMYMYHPSSQGWAPGCPIHLMCFSGVVCWVWIPFFSDYLSYMVCYTFVLLCMWGCVVSAWNICTSLTCDRRKCLDFRSCNVRMYTNRVFWRAGKCILMSLFQGVLKKKLYTYYVHVHTTGE